VGAPYFTGAAYACMHEHGYEVLDIQHLGASMRCLHGQHRGRTHAIEHHGGMIIGNGNRVGVGCREFHAGVLSSEGGKENITTVATT
jgi:hypothetical protein